MGSESRSERWSLWRLTEFVEGGLSLREAQRRLGRGEMLAPDRYRSVTGDFDRAKQAATVVLAERAAEVRNRRGPQVTFGEVELLAETPLWWTFRRHSAELREVGVLPGAVSCSIDKYDFHVWTDDEMEEYWALYSPSDGSGP